MPTKIHPMLASSTEKPFNDDAWLFEIKWDGYRAIAFVENGKARFVSRNQNDLTAQYAELASLPDQLKAATAVLDGEIVALDEEGRSSFNLMQQRAGFSSPAKRSAPRPEIPVLYYAFDVLYLDGFDLRKLPLEQRKATLASLIKPDGILRYSDHFGGQGIALFEAAKQKGLEGILAKRRTSTYEERRTQNWLKIKVTRSIECVIGGYTEPENSRQFFGSVVLGLYNSDGQLIHVGQAGSGFDEDTLRSVWKELEAREIKKNPFTGKVEALREVRWVKPELVAEIKFSDWTHAGESGSKLRAPVFLGLRSDKDPSECTLEEFAQQSERK
jgi:bifunctional non-homologous end joining protein LigD